MGARLVILLAVAALSAGGAAVYLVVAGGDGLPAGDAGPVAVATGRTFGPELTRIPRAGLLVLNLDSERRETLARVAAAGGGPLRLAKLTCHRMHFAAGRGVCVAPGRGNFGALYSAKLFDARFRVTAEIPLAGAPTRARVSPDGTRAAVTMFVSGHSYAEAGSFSTQTTLIDVRRGKAIADLEKFRVTRDGERIDAPDVNFWGVSFARDSNRFYATLASGGETYLIEGDLASRTARTIRTNVECPSLSPDGTRIAFKKVVRVDGEGRRQWQLRVLDLRTMGETPLAEPASVDDQVMWSGERLLYARGADLWTVPADGSGAPAKVVVAAHSPALLGGIPRV